MERYDVIIVGAGIAGTSLAYNLSKECPEKRVLLIDKEVIGHNEGYGSRITYSEVIKKYNLPYIHVFDGLKIGDHNGTYLTVDHKFYCVNYRSICKTLYNRSSTLFRKEIAIDVNNTTLITNKNKYSFIFLIDCSGHKSFLKKFVKRPSPIFYWIGNVKVYKGNSDLKGNYFYLLAEKEGFIEDIYVIGDTISMGHWIFTKKVDFNLIKPPRNTFSSRFLSNLKLIKSNKVVVPGNPIFPLAYKNFGFLGDSIGNVTPVVGKGVRPILESSELLAEAIKLNNLKLFEKKWKKKYLNNYLKHIAGKFNIKNRLEAGRILKDYPDLFLKIIRMDNFELPKHIKKRFSIRWKIDNLKNYLRLKLIYFKMNFY